MPNSVCFSIRFTTLIQVLVLTVGLSFSSPNLLADSPSADLSGNAPFAGNAPSATSARSIIPERTRFENDSFSLSASTETEAKENANTRPSEVANTLAVANTLDLRQLKQIEAQIKSVVSRNLDSCVAIADGTGFGSGVIVSPDGLVLTAGHVMSTQGPYEVILPSGRTVSARPLGKNLNVDSGMIQLEEPGPWPYVELAELSPASRRNDPLIGQWVVCLGHSGGFELGRLPPVRTGRVLDRRRHQVITDAVLIGGDSGGPLFDLDGKLIAIHSSIGDTIAENRHVTIDIFRRDWDRLVKEDSWGRLPNLKEPGDERRPGKIGVVVDRTTPNAVVNSVREGSPAYEVGIRAGDIVVSFNRIRIRDGDHLIETVRRFNVGQVYPIEISRNGRVLKFDIQLQ